MVHTLLLLALHSSMTTTAPLPFAPDCEARVTAHARAAQSPDWTVWGGDVHNTRFQSASGLTSRDVPRLKLRWAYSLGRNVHARSQPAVVGDKVFVGSETGNVVALDVASGCTWWTFKADAAVRTSIVAAISTQRRPAALYFGDVGANAYAVDAATRARLWKTPVDDHPAAVVTGTPQLFDGVLYVPVSSYESVMPMNPAYECCTFRGSVVALDAATGRIIWKTYTIDDSASATTKSKAGTQLRGPSGAAVWSTPTIDAKLHRLYVGSGNNYSEPVSPRSDAVVALDLKTGTVLWSRQFSKLDAYNSACDIPGKVGCPASDGPDADFGQPPILVTLPTGRRALVIGQKSGEVHALDPDHEGTSLWDVKVGSGGKLGGVHWGSASDGRSMYVALGGQLLRGVPDSTVKEKFRIESDPTVGGGLFALDLSTGRQLWNTSPESCGQRPRCSPAQSAPLTVISGVVFSGSLDGHIRAYSTATGKTVWDMDTVRDYDAVNGTIARGGSLDVAGPVVAGKVLYVMSGYSVFGAIPGNALLAFSVEGR